MGKFKASKLDFSSFMNSLNLRLFIYHYGLLLYEEKLLLQTIFWSVGQAGS